MTAELLPCPFCGEADIAFSRASNVHGSMCCHEGCSARGPVAFSRKHPDGEDASDHADAIEHWNRRAPLSARPDGSLSVPQEAIDPLPTPDTTAAGLVEGEQP